MHSAVVSDSNALARVLIDVLWWEGAGPRLPHLSLRERRPDRRRVALACLRAFSEAERVTQHGATSYRVKPHLRGGGEAQLSALH